MIGIIALIIVLVYLGILLLLSRILLWKMPAGGKKTMVSLLLLPLLAGLSFIDEIWARHQFQALCAEDNLLSYQADKIRGREVSAKALIQKNISAAVPLVEYTQYWVAADTDDIVITSKSYYAQGGWISRLIGFPQGSPPLLFNGTCRSKEYYTLFQKLNIQEINNKDDN